MSNLINVINDALRSLFCSASFVFICACGLVIYLAVSTQFETEVARSRSRSLNDLKAVMDLSWLSRKHYKVLHTKVEFDLALQEMAKYDLLGFDTETTGLNIFNLSKGNKLKDKLAGICISWKRNQGIYIPFEHTRFQNLDKRYVLRKLQPILETKSIVTHNGLFDGKVMYDEGIRLNIKHDTLLLYFNIDSNISRGSKGLKPLTEKRYNYEVIEFEDIFLSSQDYGLFTLLEEELVRAYACADADHTLQLFLDSFSYLTAGQRKSYALDILVQNELIRSEYYGKGIDMDLCRKMNDANNVDLERVSRAIYKYAHYLICKTNGIQNTDGQYVFKIGSGDELAHLFYDLLGYEVIKRNEETQRPSVDKFVLKAMLREQDGGLTDFEDKLVDTIATSAIAGCGLEWVKQGKDDVLVDRAEFASYKYKLPYLIQVWRKMEKFRTSFFAPLLENNYEGKYFSGISLTRTQTARLIDPIQTMVGKLKRLIVPYNPSNEYLVDFDFAQIEYRVMVGLANVIELAARLSDPEKDYHREGGSLIIKKAPGDITNNERKSLKSINFGIPYGISIKGIMESRYGIALTAEERVKYSQEIADLLEKWHDGLYQISDMLNRYRDQAIMPISDENLPAPLKGKKIGRIANPLGRTRIFYLDKIDGSELDKGDIASIKRQAGNYPIQSYAREIYCKAVINLCRRLRKEGLMDVRIPDESQASGYRFENKVVITSYIHDECLLNVDKAVNPNLIQKIIYEECMQEIPGHPKYYCGINVIHNWYEGKSDIYEAPVGYVKEISESGLGEYNPECVQRDFVLDQISDYIERRSAEVLHDLDSNLLNSGRIEVSDVIPKFQNYYVKGKMADFFGTWRKPATKDSTDELGQLIYSTGGGGYDEFTEVLVETYLFRLHDRITVVYPSGLTIEFANKGEDWHLIAEAQFDMAEDMTVEDPREGENDFIESKYHDLDYDEELSEGNFRLLDISYLIEGFVNSSTDNAVLHFS